MYSIDLKPYQQYNIYLTYFDILIKDIYSNKEQFLTQIGIAPSSYRRAKKEDIKLSEEIILKLAKYFNKRHLNIAEIEELNTLLNNIYYNYYYKVNDNIEYYLECLKSYENTTLEPIILMFKLLLELSTVEDVKKEIVSSNTNYQMILKFEKFLTPNLKELKIIFDILAGKEIEDIKLNFETKIGIIYSLYAIVLQIRNDYLSCLFMANKAKSIYQKENNIVRLFMANITIFNCLNSLNNFNLTYQDAKSQLRALRSINYQGKIYNLTLLNYIIAAYGIGNYKEIKLIIKTPYQTTQAVLYLMSLYQIGDDFDLEATRLKELKHYSNEYIDKVVSYLKYKDKESLDFLQKSRLQNVVKEFIMKL